jgi:hypothetical protein
MGDYDGAVGIAERHGGRDSPEFREAERLKGQARRIEAERRLRERVEARDWEGAAALCRSLLAEAKVDRRDGLARALEVCGDLARAQDLERLGDAAGARAIYRRHAGLHGLTGEHVRERLRALDPDSVK